ncbi:16S rRNA (guanine(966)-N(2))-methyltransferase RsmD [Haliovirga abyssi]|uniref:Methyltransferase n=1 Tax=Haliovirga abyssi TaxID=2996794 RepID=A0AAU9E1J8_9FUSO|nr:16S rRNA (guanine(966)-N(2))-methyltransferase RsmD [Haliovirga abyssi]BDU50250.1 methyltransferase [Haliovirga abyssi]
MRIIAGTAKNKRIKSQSGHNVRPTLERVKESLFSILQPYINDSVFLDLYGGTGSIALEALSRGAKRAIIIEKNGEALRIIIENVNSLGFEDRCRAYRNEVLRAIEILSNKRETFDIIFMDPPYKDEVCEEVIAKILDSNLLEENGLIIAEHHIKEKLPDVIGKLNKIDERKYSGKVLTFYS